MTYRFFVQGYIVGNPATGDKIDENYRIPFSHSFGIISDQLYEVCLFLVTCFGDRRVLLLIAH